MGSNAVVLIGISLKVGSSMKLPSGLSHSSQACVTEVNR